MIRRRWHRGTLVGGSGAAVQGAFLHDTGFPAGVAGAVRGKGSRNSTSLQELCGVILGRPSTLHGGKFFLSFFFLSFPLCRAPFARGRGQRSLAGRDPASCTTPTVDIDPVTRERRKSSSLGVKALCALLVQCNAPHEGKTPAFKQRIAQTVSAYFEKGARRKKNVHKF